MDTSIQSFSPPYAPKLSAATKMGLLDAFIDDVEAAWDWKAFLEVGMLMLMMISISVI